MTLVEMIRKRGNRAVATAKAATPATKQPRTPTPVATVAGVAATPTPIVTDMRPSPILTAEDGLTHKGASIASPVMPDSGSEPTYCERCGGGYWIQVTHEAAFQCGRCLPSESRVETRFVPGGTPPPKSQPRAVVSKRDLIMEPAAPNARPIYWETGTGRILGPATPEFLARDGDTFWIVTTFDGQIRWINADQLRSKKAFEQQRVIQVVEQVRF